MLDEIVLWNVFWSLSLDNFIIAIKMGKFLHSFQFLKVANLYIQYQQLGEKEQVPILKSLKRKHYEIIK